MIIVDRSALVEYPAQTMYELVEDIESYPRFLPWCSRTEAARPGPRRTLATLHVAFRGIRQKFSTDNRNTPGGAIEMRLQSGPFKHLKGVWRFEPLRPDACKVSLHLEYELSTALVGRIAGPVFEYIANTFVDAFVRRAEALYGKP